ncbi:thiol-disulfide oxidoreductase DCC family protein [Metabacillus niabensis]|uniref:thiol-disulfide oxidoreductase DCC family protein n=1 Tax=Metabacillus niabensis TaxID=324854 RepID=UPI001CF93CEF|nr:thiol-disulfide oxidoreductase DCC family protein [Metabacillus niabensis]
MNNHNTSILLFDGVCHFCDRSVQFLIRHDHKGIIKFAALQSNKGQELLREHQLSTTDLNSLVFIHGQHSFTKSTAVREICRQLGGKWKLLAIMLKLTPRPLRDTMYDLVAKNRYKWFGQKEQCMIPSKEVRNRFLQ